MTARLDLLCHAPTSAVRRARFPADEPIEQKAWQRLAATSHRRRRPDHCLTSPALRAVQTAEALGLVATPEPALRDLDHGRWAGLALDEVHAREPDAVADWLRDPAAAPHGGESVLALLERIAPWLAARAAIPGTTVAITHAAVVRAVIVRALEAGAQSFQRLDVAPLTTVRLSASAGQWRLGAIIPFTMPEHPGSSGS